MGKVMDGLVDGKCQDCVDKSQSKKDEAIRRIPEGQRSQLQTRGDRYDYIAIVCEASKDNLALR